MAIDYRGLLVVVEVKGIEGPQKEFLPSEAKLVTEYWPGLREHVRNCLQIPEQYKDHILMYSGGDSPLGKPIILVDIKIAMSPHLALDHGTVSFFQEAEKIVGVLAWQVK